MNTTMRKTNFPSKRRSADLRKRAFDYLQKHGPTMATVLIEEMECGTKAFDSNHVQIYNAALLDAGSVKRFKVELISAPGERAPRLQWSLIDRPLIHR